MRTHSYNSGAMWVGRLLGSAWRAVVRQHSRAAGWMGMKGIPMPVTNIVLWGAKLVFLAALLCAIVCLASALILASLLARILGNVRSSDGTTKWAIGEQTSHKKNPAYDPINYNDADDPRFNDPRYDDR